MKGAASGRINFLKRRHSAFTYKSMVWGLVGWCVVLGVVYGLGFVREVYLKKSIFANRELGKRLEEQRDRHIGMIERLSQGGMTGAAKGDMAARIERRPMWSSVIRGLTKSLPPHAWLSDVSVLKEADGTLALEVKGRAKSQRAIASFITQMEGGGMFKGTELQGSSYSGDAAGVWEYRLKTHPTRVVF